MSEPERLSKWRVRRNFARAAEQYERAAFLSREVLTRMLERLELVRITPQLVLDLGSGTGLAARALAQRYAAAEIIALDLSLPMLTQRTDSRRWRLSWRTIIGRHTPAKICADFEQLPIRSNSVDLIVSNLALHWSDRATLAFAEASRVLRAGGLMMFSTFGPDTLKELAQAVADHAGRSPVHSFMDMHDLGDALVGNGFSDPVMEMECLTLTYESVDGLLRELKASGGVSASSGAVGLRTPRWRERVAQRYEHLRHEGRLPATFELVYGHAWKAPARPAQTADGRAVIHFQPRRREM